MLFEYLNDFYSAYLDNILIFSETLEEYKVYIKKVLIKLKEARLNLDINKYEFYIKETKYLGLIVRRNSIKIDPAKIKAI